MPSNRDQITELLDNVDHEEEQDTDHDREKKARDNTPMVNYARKLRKGKYQFITDDIDQRFHTSQPDWTKYAVVLHKLVAEEVDYHKSGTQVPLASKMLDKLSGDCQDQTVLLSNLFIASGFDVQIIAVRPIGDRNDHVLPQVKTPVPADTAKKQLKEAYNDLFGLTTGEMARSTVHGEPYFIADPEWSSYIGDRESLTGNYIEETSDGWSWHSVKNTWPVPSEREIPSNETVDVQDSRTPVSNWGEGPSNTSKSSTSRTRRSTGSSTSGSSGTISKIRDVEDRMIASGRMDEESVEERRSDRQETKQRIQDLKDRL